MTDDTSAAIERDMSKLIDERDSAEWSLSRMYAAVMKRAPEWSSGFGYSDAVDETAAHIATLEARAKEAEAKVAAAEERGLVFNTLPDGRLDFCAIREGSPLGELHRRAFPRDPNIFEV